MSSLNRSNDYHNIGATDRRFKVVQSKTEVKLAFSLLVMCARQEYKTRKGANAFISHCIDVVTDAPYKYHPHMHKLMMGRTYKRPKTRQAWMAYRMIFVVVAKECLYEWYYTQVESEPVITHELPF